MSEKQPNEPMIFSHFADWCRHINSLSEEARHTVKVLLEKAGTDDAQAAEQILSSMTELELWDDQITDISIPRLAHQSDQHSIFASIKLPTSASSARSPI
jgi:internalin A